MIRLSRARLLSVLSYDKKTGFFSWLVNLRRRPFPSDHAGTTMRNGYISISVDGERFLAHRLAWFYVHAAWPANQIDHRNGVRNDNAIENLRDADQALNSQNLRKAQPRSKTGFLGVFPYFKTGRYFARIHAAGKYHRLGVFDKPEDAHRAYLDAKRRLHPGGLL